MQHMKYNGFILLLCFSALMAMRSSAGENENPTSVPRPSNSAYPVALERAETCAIGDKCGFAIPCLGRGFLRQRDKKP